MKSFYFFIFLFLFPAVYAGIFTSEDITFSVNQTEYYFNVGENSIIPLDIENTYGKSIDGILKITFTQEINQNGAFSSSVNSQSIPFKVKDGKNTEYLEFGTANSQSSILVDLEFNFIEKDSKIVRIENLKINFVEDKNEKQNKENTQKSKSKKTKQQPQNKQENQPPSTEQKLQNNQMNQDSNALKKQIQRQNEKKERLKQEFQKKLGENKDIAKEHKKLIDKGYKPESGNFNPTKNDSGDFEMQYKKENGKTAEMKGSMENGEMKSLQTLTAEDKKEIIKNLEENKDFQKIKKYLDKNKFEKQNVEISIGKNKTDIKIEYSNLKNKTAIITADVINGTIKKVLIQKDENSFKRYYWSLIIIILITGYFIYYKYFKKSKDIEVNISKNPFKENPFNYKFESKKLLKKSIKLFNSGSYKDAYGKAGQSLRMFLGYKYNMKKESTNDEIIEILKMNNLEFKDIKKCFDLCSLVEFAKYKSNKKDFEIIIEIIKKILK